jgi:hypothetical protein
VFKNSPDSLDCFIAIHKWHHAVCEDKRVPVRISFIYCFLDVLYQLLSVIAAVNARFYVGHSQDSH